MRFVTFACSRARAQTTAHVLPEWLEHQVVRVHAIRMVTQVRNRMVPIRWERTYAGLRPHCAVMVVCSLLLAVNGANVDLLVAVAVGGTRFELADNLATAVWRRSEDVASTPRRHLRKKLGRLQLNNATESTTWRLARVQLRLVLVGRRHVAIRVKAAHERLSALFVSTFWCSEIVTVFDEKARLVHTLK